MRPQASFLLWVCQMFATSWAPFSLQKHVSQHLLRESWIATPKLLNEHLCLHPRQRALSVGLRKVLHKALPRQQSAYPLKYRDVPSYTNRKCGPLLCKSTGPESMIQTKQWMEKSMSLQGTVNPSKELHSQINGVLPLCWDPYCSATARMVKYCNERRQWGASSSPEEESTISKHRCIKESQKKEAYKDWMLDAKCYQLTGPAKARLQTRIQSAYSIC